MVLGLGGGIATIFGLVDDILDIKVSIKLCAQLFLSVWIFLWIHNYVPISLNRITLVTLFPFIILFLIWMINAYNFVDGIDGMAISGALYISINITIVILFTNKNSDLLSLF